MLYQLLLIKSHIDLTASVQEIKGTVFRLNRGHTHSLPRKFFHANFSNYVSIATRILQKRHKDLTVIMYIPFCLLVLLVSFYVHIPFSV